MAEKNFDGTGMKFPPQVNSATGRFALSQGMQSVKESVYLILMTGKTERMLRPSFGSRIAEYAFMDMTETRMTLLAGNLRSEILQQEPRISDLEISIEPVQEKGCLLVNISYIAKEEQKRDRLAVPFYLYEASAGEGAEDANVYKIQ